MASKLKVLVLLFAILIAQQTFAQKSIEEDLKDAIQNLTNTVNAIINDSRYNLENQVQDMVDFGENLTVTNADFVYGTLAVNFRQIDYQIELANKLEVDVSSCNHSEKQQMIQIAYKATDQAKICMINSLHDGQSAVFVSMAEIMKFQEVVNDFKRKAENCHDADCSKTITNDITWTMTSLLLNSKVILSNITRKIYNVKNDIESCIEAFINLGVNKISTMARDVVYCIHEILNNNGQL